LLNVPIRIAECAGITCLDPEGVSVLSIMWLPT
jgi:hypothetical protein